MNLEQAIKAIQGYKEERDSVIKSQPNEFFLFGEETVEVEYIGDTNPFERSSDE